MMRFGERGFDSKSIAVAAEIERGMGSGFELDLDLSRATQYATLEFDLGVRSKLHVRISFEEDSDTCFKFSSGEMRA